MAAVLCMVVLLFGCGAQTAADDRPTVSVQNGNRGSADTTAVEMIEPDQKMPTEVPGQALPKEDAEAAAVPVAVPTDEEADAEEAEPVEEIFVEDKSEPSEEISAEEESKPAEEPPIENKAESVAAVTAENKAEPSETVPAEEESEHGEMLPAAYEVEPSQETPATEEAVQSVEIQSVAEAEPSEEVPAGEEAVSAEEADVSEFLELTGLKEVVQSLEAGERIVGITYSEGLGEIADWFYTTDIWEIQDLWTSLQMIETDSTSKWFFTDWYPAVELYLSDDSVYRVAFNGHLLDTPENTYQLKNDGMFWTLTSILKDRYKDMPMEEEYVADSFPDDHDSHTTFDDDYGYEGYDDYDYYYDYNDYDDYGICDECGRQVEEEYYVPNSVDLYLPANPTTGYSWLAEVEDEDIVEVKDQYYADSRTLGMTGVGGMHWFHIDGLREGVTSVRLSYQRPWEDNNALYVFVYRLSVDEWNNVVIWGFEMNPKA